MQKVFVVTGTTNGIGTVTAMAIADVGHCVVMANRDQARALVIRDKIRTATGNNEVHALPCNLASLDSIRAFSDVFKKQFKRLDVLINNAGLISMDFKTSEDGIELVFAVNHLGPFLLTNLLLDIVRSSAPARIINVSSRIHRRGKLDLNDINYRNGYNARQAYSRSKLANVLFSLALHRRINSENITVNCLHPGVIASNLFPRDRWWLRLGVPLLKWFRISNEQGARTNIYLALSKEVEGVSGCYFDEHQKIRQPATIAMNMDLQEALWEKSLMLTGLYY